MPDLEVTPAPIDGMFVLRLPLHEDDRGWFKENWQRAKMMGLGLPDFAPVQHSLAHNHRAGTTRGVHAEPWDKLVSIARGRAFGAWVDLREGPGFGTVFTTTLDPGTAVFVPRGVGNSYQTLEDDTVYSYLVNAHWRPDAAYTFLALDDPTTAIPWPIPLERATISEKDSSQPTLEELTPFAPPRMLVLGAAGQLGRALLRRFPDAEGLDRSTLDLADPASVAALDLDGVGVVVNAAAHTAVDRAETDEGRREAWATNVTGLGALVEACRRQRVTLVHVSSDYVYDGTAEIHREDEPVAPLGVYGQTKAAGDALVATLPSAYVVRTSWVVGDGPNFVRTMARLARQGVSPRVVDDQVGRITTTDELARGIAHLLAVRPEPGVYHLSHGGEPVSWADLAQRIFVACGRSADDVTPVSTEEYDAGLAHASAPRPPHSTLDLAKIEATGFAPVSGDEALAAYLADLAAEA